MSRFAGQTAAVERGSENGNRYSPTGREILTGVTRQLIDVTSPRPEQMDVRDIARSLSRQERFTGHCPLRPSVAAHSLACEYIARVLMAESGADSAPCSPAGISARRAALMHDAAEFLVSDLSGAVKKQLRLMHGPLNTSPFDVLEDRAQAAIAARFDCSDAGFEALVHEADILSCAYELAYDGWCEDAHPPEWLRDDFTVAQIYALSNDEAAQQFVQRAAELGMA